MDILKQTEIIEKVFLKSVARNTKKTFRNQTLQQKCRLGNYPCKILWTHGQYFVVLERHRVVPENIDLVTILKTQQTNQLKANYC